MSTVKSFSVGIGDMFYINHNSDNFTTIDCYYETEEERDADFNEMKSLADKKGIRRFISTHPDEDHIKGISEFCDTVNIFNFYVVKNEAIKNQETESFKKYCELRDSKEKAFYVAKGCTRKWMNISDEERDCAGINYLWPITSNDNFIEALNNVKNGKGYNNISPIFTYSVENGVKMMWMGDLEESFLEKIEGDVEWEEVDVLFAPHHGRESGKVPNTILKKLNPTVIVIGEAPSEQLDYYDGYNTIIQNSAKDITFECNTDYVDVYVEASTYKVKFLENKGKSNKNGDYYLGSFKVKDM